MIGVVICTFICLLSYGVSIILLQIRVDRLEKKTHELELERVDDSRIHELELERVDDSRIHNL